MTRPGQSAFGDARPHIAALEAKAEAAARVVDGVPGVASFTYALDERPWPRDVLLPCGTRVPAGVIAEWSRGVFCEVDLLLAAVVGMLRSMPQGRV